MNSDVLCRILEDYIRIGAKIKIEKDANGNPIYITITPKEPFTEEQWTFIEEMSKIK